LAHERRALTYLVNEFLLLRKLRLTSITLAEEIEGGESNYLEEWEDVGLDVKRPPSLLT